MSRSIFLRTLFGIFLLASFIAIGTAISLRGTSAEAPVHSEKYAKLEVIESRLDDLHERKGKPQPGDWLASHKESGQSFAQYVRSEPNTLTEKRNVLYVQPIGTFDRKRTEIVQLSSEFMGHFFGCQVKILETMPDAAIPKKARRIHPEWDVPQLLSTHILDEVLKPNLPDDAFAMIAFTSTDLWPGEGWNFVFGQASLRGRVGVWSINRNGDPNLSEDDFKLCLLRTIKTATHETGHMFSMPHCIKFECNMNGSNHMREADKQPIYLCPKCLAKTLWSTEADPVNRYKALATFCDENDFDEQAAFYRKSIELLSEIDD